LSLKRNSNCSRTSYNCTSTSFRRMWNASMTLLVGSAIMHVSIPPPPPPRMTQTTTKQFQPSIQSPQFSAIHDNKYDSTNTNTNTNTKEDEKMILLMLDHMRDRQRYVRTIRKWAKNLDLTGRILFYRHILIILEGNDSNLKQYIQLQRTHKVDVNSKGEKCKERLMEVLACEVRNPSGPSPPRLPRLPNEHKGKAERRKQLSDTRTNPVLSQPPQPIRHRLFSDLEELDMDVPTLSQFFQLHGLGHWLKLINQPA